MKPFRIVKNRHYIDFMVHRPHGASYEQRIHAAYYFSGQCLYIYSKHPPLEYILEYIYNTMQHHYISIHYIT